VGQPLFLRTGRGVTLTEAGQRLFEVTQAAFAAIDLGFEEVCRVQGVTQGTIRVAAIHTLSYYFLSDAIERFMGMFPHVNISLMARGSPDVVTLVESGEAQLGFVYDAAVVSEALATVPLFDDDMCLIVPATESADTLLDLRTQTLRLVAFPKPYALRRMMEQSTMQVDYVAEAETVDAMLKLVSSGVGSCILPTRIPGRLLADYKLKKQAVGQPLLRRRVVAVYRHDRPLLPMVQDLMNCASHVSKQLNRLATQRE